jgi:ferredoxin-NADP reductase
MKSLMQQALALEQAPTITFLRQADAAGPYQQNLTRSYAESLDHFFCIPVDGDWTTALAEAARVAGALAGHDVYAAGPAAALVSLQSTLEAAGLPSSRFRGEVVE